MNRGAEKMRVPLLMRDRSFYHTFLILAGTLILEQAVVLSVNLADNLMIGSYNETALAAVAAVNQIVFVVQQVIYGVTNGVIVLSSQYWGKQQTAPIRRLVCLGLRLEAAQKLSAMRPETVGRASRISGVSPADVAVLLLYLKEQKL